MAEQLNIRCPKQDRSSRSGWEAFFPYYAGFPSSFAHTLLESAQLDRDALILDPWNGSGTTTQVASRLGFPTIGCDLNPVMVIVARARCLLPREGDSIEPLAKKINKEAVNSSLIVEPDDPLLGWFDAASTEGIRCLEASIREHLLGTSTLQRNGTHFDCMSSLAATFYVALFLTCRSMCSGFQSSNPTWLRKRKDGEARIAVSRGDLLNAFMGQIKAMSSQVIAAGSVLKSQEHEPGAIDIRLLDSTKLLLPDTSVDFVLTSPPYCTRIDYTAATRIELAVIAPLLNNTAADLSRQMIGSTRVPQITIEPDPEWGETCNRFLKSVRSHTSRASSGYYIKTHLDYFFKLTSSIKRIKRVLKPGARAVFVIQDSYYKDVHNDLPTILSELGEANGMKLSGITKFRLARSMSEVNPYSRVYCRPSGAVEAVLTFVGD